MASTLIERQTTRGNASNVLTLDTSSYTLLGLAFAVHVETGGPKDLSIAAKSRHSSGGMQVTYQATSLDSAGAETLSDWTVTKACADATQTSGFVSLNVEGIDELEITASLASGAVADHITLEASGT